MWRHKAIRQLAALLVRPFKAAAEPNYSYSAKSFLYVPEEVWRAYEEACRVLHISPAGSATISRRCLQLLLMSLGHNQRTLYKQIRSAADTDRQSAMIGTHGTYADMIRYIGNLAAHPSSVNGKLEPIEID
jgi:hypothetical protein